MAQLLISRQNKISTKRGDIVNVRASGHPFGSAKELENFVLADIPDINLENIEQYETKWDMGLNFSVINANTSTGEFDIRISATNAGSVKGSVSREQVESYLNEWNCTVTTVAPNSIDFNVLIADVVQSPKFWGVPSLGNVSISELAINGSVHTFQIDYSASNINNPTTIDRKIRAVGGTIISSTSSQIITIDIDRSAVRTVFQDDIKKSVNSMVEKFRYYVPEGVVANLEGQPNQTATVMWATAQNYIRDKVND